MKKQMLSKKLNFKNLIPLVKGDPFWENYLNKIVVQKSNSVRLHLAIFIEPFLQYVLEGLKTVESRFSIHRRAPYNSVANGDIILLKRSGGPILGICCVSEVWFYQLDSKSWNTIRNDFAKALCAQDPDFWTKRQKAAFATLMKIEHVLELEPLTFDKKDRLGWVILQNKQEQLEL